MNQDAFPIMTDFSKLDVFALGVFIINMLTLDFAFENAVNDNDTYKKFLNEPQHFFNEHKMQIDAELINLLRGMLEFD